MVLRGVQPLPDLRKGCVLRNFTQVEFYISRGFLKFNSIFFFYLAQEKLQKCASKRAVTRSRHRRVLVRSSIYFLLDAKYVSTLFLSFATADKNLRKVRFTQVEYFASLGVPVFAPPRGRT
jgi:hypothetical protein